MGARGRERTHGQSLQLGWDSREEPSTAQGDVQEAPSAADAAPSRMSPRLRRSLATGAALLLVVALTVGLPRLLTASGGPEGAVTDFLQAVVDGDIEQVRAHTEAASDASAAALTPDVMRGATGGIESFEIEDVQTDGDSATVIALLHGGTSTQSVTFSLSAEAGSAFAPVHWVLDPVALPEFVIDVPFAVEAVALNGVELSTEELFVSGTRTQPQIAVQLLPGSYELSLVAAGPWARSPVRSLEVPLTLGQWRKPVRDLRLELTEEAEQEVQVAVRAHLEDCLHSRTSGADGCPELGEEGEDEAWTLRGEPEIEYEAGWDGQLWSVLIAATAAPAAEDEAARSTPFTLYGSVYIDPGGALRFRSEGPDGGGAISYVHCADAETGRITGIVMPEQGQASVDWANPCP